MNKIKLFEAGLTSNANQKLGRAYVFETYGDDTYDFFWSKLIEAFPSAEILNNCTNGKSKAYFTRGVLRIAHDEIAKGNDYEGDLRISMEDIISQLSFKPMPELNQDFNGMSIDELWKYVIGSKRKPNDTLNMSLPHASMEDDGKVYDFGEYKIYTCFTYDSINKFKLKGQKDICYIGNLKSFIKDEGQHGIRAKYACVRNDYASVVKSPNLETYPFDDFGLSIIFISVSPTGKAEICSRYNNGHVTRGLKKTEVCPFKSKLQQLGITTNATFLTKEEVENIVLKNQAKFEDVFKPFNKETFMFRRQNRGNLVRYSTDMEKIKDDKLRAERELHDEPIMTNWLRQNGREPFPFQFKMAENIKLNMNDIKFILQETIKKLNLIS